MAIGANGNRQMLGYASFIVRSLQSQPLGAAAAAAAMVAAGLAYSDIGKITLSFTEPGWLTNRSVEILLAAIGVLVVSFAYVFSRQATKEKYDSEHIRQLRLQRYITFGEIAAAISESDSAYLKQEILDRLIKAAVAGEFSEWTGHSRMRISPLDVKSAPIPERPIIKIRDLDGFGTPSGGDRYSPGSIFYRAMLLCAPMGKTEIGSIELFALERADFRRWYRRFRNGRYEY